MKRLPFLFLLLALACPAEPSSSSQESQAAHTLAPTTSSPAIQAAAPARRAKRALIVAIGQYPDPATNGYGPIHADHDVPLIREALKSQQFDDIRVLVNEQATREAMLGALDKLARDTRPDDIVVFHYSGHGDQITDDNGDELDGYDEILVPYGAPGRQSFKTREALIAYTGDRHIRDDALNTYVARMRANAGSGGNVVIWLDACHSGTGARGGPDDPQVRGADAPIGPPASTRGQGQAGEDGGLFEAQVPQARGGDVSALAPYVVISASRQGELNYETQDETQNGRVVGSLSLALNRALAQVEPGDDYTLLFDEVKKVMLSKGLQQMPQIEGDVGTEVFSGAAVARDPYYPVERVLDNGNIVLAGGSFTGLSKGTQVAFYPKRTQTLASAEGEPLATGAVTTARATDAIVTLAAQPAAGVDLADSRAFVTAQAFGDLALTVELGNGLDPALRERLAALLDEMPVTDVVPDHADLIFNTRASRYYKGAVSENSLFLLTAADSMPVVPPMPARLTSAGELDFSVKNYLQNYARNQYLKHMSLKDKEIKVALEVVPATHLLNDFGEIEGADTAAYKAVMQGGTWAFPAFERDGTETRVDGYLLRVENTGTRDVFVTVLDLLPNGCIDPLLPRDGYYSREETWILAGSTVLFKNLPLAVNPKYGHGVEVLKLFATTTEVDFSPLLTSCGAKSRSGMDVQGNLSPLEQMMLDLDLGRSRSDPIGVPTGSGSTHAVEIRVVPPEALTTAQ